MNVAVVYSLATKRKLSLGLEAVEEDTMTTAKLIATSLMKLPGYTAKVIAVGESLTELSTPIHADVIFNGIEWTGFDLPLSITAMEQLLALGLPVTGADVKNWEETTNKILMKKVFDVYAVPTPKWVTVSDVHDLAKVTIPFPLIVKVAYEHGGTGLGPHSIVRSKQALKKTVTMLLETYDQPVIIEEYIDGREFEVTLLEREGKVSVLPIVENCYADTSKDKILTYDGRWAENAEDFVAVVSKITDLPQAKQTEIADLCARVYQQMNFQDYARFDLRMDNHGKVYIIEANSNPGLDENEEYSTVPVAFHAANLTFPQFLEQIIESAMWRKSNKTPRS